MTFLSHLSGLLPHKFSVADLDIFLGLSYEVTSSWGLPQPITKKKVVASPVCPTTFHTIPSLCLFHTLEGRKNMSVRILLWKSILLGQIDTLISSAEWFPGNLNYRLAVIQELIREIYFVSQREKREKYNKEKRRTKEGIKLDDLNCRRFVCLCLNIHQFIYDEILPR